MTGNPEKEINGQLASPNTLVRNTAVKESREVLGEYIALLDKSRNGKGNDAPWEYVNAMKKSSQKDDSAKTMLKTAEKASGMMSVVASGDIGAFQKKLDQELTAIKAANAPKVPINQRPGYGLDT